MGLTDLAFESHDFYLLPTLRGMSISALEAGLGLEASVVCIQEPFLENQSLARAGFNLYS